ncbi:uncharacterized protein LOC129907695 [Episyrphus balteatus]|uniref:uncharacterized protein LOC129907695 n=1 Tax=Episyrphus balteatus TaxID=286459 RepID=UPI0024869836|nr:uncharacterized protein LOC129907695 [Episyrphus balteatus]
METNNNTLVEIPLEDWSKLRDLYENRKLESNSYNMIQNYINWLKKDPSLKDLVKFYSLNGDWSDGTFVLEDNKIHIMMNTLSESQERLLTALNCFDKKPSRSLCAVPLRIKQTIETYLIDLGIEKESFKFSRTIWHHIDMKTALTFDTTPPKGITLSQLQEEHIDTVNNVWPFRTTGSEVFVGRLIRFNQSIGAFDENGKLISWCLTLPIGALGLLQVEESHKRKGFGSLMVRCMAKMNAERGVETIAPVVDENTASRAMFRGLGFQEIDQVFWFHKPETE